MNLGVENSKKRGQAMVMLSPFGERKSRCVLVRTYPRIDHPDYKEQDFSYTNECDAVLVKHAQTEVELLDNKMLKTTRG